MNLKSSSFARQFTSRFEKAYAINQLELLLANIVARTFRLLCLRETVKFLSDHQTIQPLLNINRAHEHDSRKVTLVWMQSIILIKISNTLQKN